MYQAFRALEESHKYLNVVNNTDAIDQEVRDFHAERGVRSRPWLRYALLIHHTEEKDALVGDGIGKCKEARVVQTLGQFLEEHCLVDRNVVCPGFRV